MNRTIAKNALLAVVALAGNVAAQTPLRPPIDPRTPSSTSEMLVLDGLANHTCVLRSGRLRCWGSNYASTYAAETTGSVGPLDAPFANVRQASLGEYRTCAVLSNGTVECMGRNEAASTICVRDENGYGTDVRCDRRPTALTGITNAAQVELSNYFGCALLTNGEARCWGGGSNGVLGNAAVRPSAQPVAVTGIQDARLLAVGGEHACVGLADTTVRCWGRNNYGQLGTPPGTQTFESSPVAVAGLRDVVQLALSSDTSCARKNDGTIWCWGDNRFGTFGDGTTTRRHTPTQVQGINDAVQLAGAHARFCALRHDGTVWCWGTEFSREVLLSETPDTCTNSNERNSCSLIPRVVPGIRNAVELALGSQHSCVRIQGSAPTVRCWGRNDTGQLGIGHRNTTTPLTTPRY